MSQRSNDRTLTDFLWCEIYARVSGFALLAGSVYGFILVGYLLMEASGARMENREWYWMLGGYITPWGWICAFGLGVGAWTGLRWTVLGGKAN